MRGICSIPFISFAFNCQLSTPPRLHNQTPVHNSHLIFNIDFYRKPNIGIQMLGIQIIIIYRFNRWTSMSGGVHFDYFDCWNGEKKSQLSENQKIITDYFIIISISSECMPLHWIVSESYLFINKCVVFSSPIFNHFHWILIALVSLHFYLFGKYPFDKSVSIIRRSFVEIVLY